MMKLNAKAPISAAERAKLKRDAGNLRATADRKQVTLDRWDEAREGAAARDHFELGCWLYRFTKLRGLSAQDYAQECANVLMRLFLSGITSPGYQFFTVFDFGERQFDSIFEDGREQTDAVMAILRREMPKDTTGQLAAAFKYFGWEA